MRSTAALRLGDPAAARASARAARALMREHGNRLFECQGYVALARASMQPPNAAEPDEAESALSAAMALIEETGARGVEPMVREACAELARLRGDEATAERELREAHRLCGQIGAAGHVERMERTWPQLLRARS